MPEQDPSLSNYRRFLVTLLLLAGCVAVYIGAKKLGEGKLFAAFLALLMLGYLVLLMYGYVQDDRERN